MNLWQSMQGMLLLEITSAEPERFLQILNTLGIPLFQIEIRTALTIRCYILRSDYRLVSNLCGKYGNKLETVSRSGLYWKMGRLLKRPVLMAGAVFLISLILFLPTRVFFFSVEGNTQIPDRRILEAAENCGIRFGASRRSIRSEKMKNALLASVPQLQWAGINTRGCHAVISVRERDLTAERKTQPAITSMVAVRDGILTACTVTKGNAVCAVGQSVQKGQLLISPYTDCGITIKVGPVDGEVYGQTNHKIHAVTPATWANALQSGRETQRYSMIIGKKRINFWKDSGISDATCGRMYEEYCITLPGGFPLPVSVGIETIYPRTLSTEDISKETADAMLRSFASEYVCSQMIAGTILHENVAVHAAADVWSLEGSYVCDEMIGRIVAERNGETNE